MNAKQFEEMFKRGEQLFNEKSYGNIKCKLCFDCGFAWVKIDEARRAWAYCKCSEGNYQHELFYFKLPHLDSKMLSLFTVEEFPIKSFIAVEVKNMQTIENRCRAFRNSLRKSEETWKG